MGQERKREGNIHAYLFYACFLSFSRGTEGQERDIERQRDRESERRQRGREER